MYRRFGSKVTIVEQGSRLIRREDEDVSQAVREILENEGIDVQLDATCLSARSNGNGIAVGLDCAGGGREVAKPHLLLAVGRVPNTDDLGRPRGRLDRRARLHRGRRTIAHERARHLGARRLQRARRVHAHRVQRLRDRRGEPARQRSAQGVRSHRGIRAVRRPAARPHRHDARASEADRPPAARRHAPDDARRPRGGKRRAWVS